MKNMNPKTLDIRIGDALPETFGRPLLLPEDPLEWSKLPSWLVDGLLEQDIYQHGDPENDAEEP